MMLGSKGILTPLIPNCYVLCTFAILKTFVICSFFFKKWLLTHVFGGSQVQKSSCKQACVGFMNLGPWYHHIIKLRKVNIFPDFKMRDLRSYKTGDNFSGCLDKLAGCRR